jgi:molecular chaperone HscB
VNLQSTDFELFRVKQQFAQDSAVLDSRWKDLQRQAHPDKFSAQGEAAQRIAMQWSVRINEAYQRLKDPLRRAAYLCELTGAPINAHSNTAMPGAFLMQQMQWREDLDDATNPQAIEALRDNVEEYRRALLSDCADQLDTRHDPAAAALSVRALMFIEKLLRDLDQRSEQFDF